MSSFLKLCANGIAIFHALLRPARGKVRLALLSVELVTYGKR
jgi:hypothetical protein